jgi:hypothetical protein
MRSLTNRSRRALVGRIALALVAGVPGGVQTVEARREGKASLDVHKALCPAGYSNEDYFTDCHPNGVAGSVFSLTGPGGRQEATTIIDTSPGPGIARFQHLPGGVYKLTDMASGPADTPVRVFCFLADAGERERTWCATGMTCPSDKMRVAVPAPVLQRPMPVRGSLG